MTPNSDSQTSRRGEKIIITATTLVPVGLAAVIIVTAFTLKTWIDTQFAQLSGEIAEVKFQMRRYEDSMNSRTADRWAGVSMELWAERLARANPNLNVPSVREVLRLEQQK